MVWTAPRTWVTSEVVTAAQLNTHLRDNLLWAAFHHGCRAYKSAAQTVPSGNTDVVTFSTESYDTDTFHSTSSLTSRFVAPVAGYYRVKFVADVDADAAQHNRFTPSLRLNAAGSSVGGTLLEAHAFTGHTNIQNGLIEWTGSLAVADYVEAFFLSSSEARDLNFGTDATNLEIAFVGF